MKSASHFALVTASFALLGTAPIEREIKPGEGVLCLGGFIYFAERTGQVCYPDQDKEYQDRLAKYTERLDDYIIRNSDGGPATLDQFKTSQGMKSEDQAYMCEGDPARNYEHFRKIEKAELDAAVDKMLKRDGPPTFGDCV